MNHLSTLILLTLVLCSPALVNAARPMGGRKGFKVVTTRELAFPADGSLAEFDSLNQFYAKKVIKKIKLVHTYQIDHHWAEHNNSNFVEIMEVADWDDLEMIGHRIQEFLEKAIPGKEDRERYMNSLDKYFVEKRFH